MLNHDANEMVIDLSKNMKEIEGDIIRYMLEINNGDKTQVAKKLGLGRTTVWRKISELSMRMMCFNLEQWCLNLKLKM